MRTSSSAMRMRVIRLLSLHDDVARAHGRGQLRRRLRTGHGDVEHDRGTAAGGVDDGAVPVVGLGDGIHDRQTEARTLDGRDGLDRRSKRRNTRWRAAVGMPGPWFPHPQMGGAVVDGAADLDGTALRGVHRAVCRRAGSRPGTDGRRRRGCARGALLDAPGVSRDRSREFGDAVVSAPTSMTASESAPVSMSARASMSSTRRESGRARRMPRSRVSVTSCGSAGIHHLEVAAHDGDRRLQLVPHIVEQLALGIDRHREAVEHGVDRGREIRDLVVAAGAQARAQVVDRDRVGGGAQTPQRREQAAGDEVYPATPMRISTASAVMPYVVVERRLAPSAGRPR